MGWELLPDPFTLGLEQLQLDFLAQDQNEKDIFDLRPNKNCFQHINHHNKLISHHSTETTLIKVQADRL